MRILICPCVMEIGGSQLNAIELADGLARRGHEVVLSGPRGELVQTVRDLGLEYVHTPVEHRWPTLRGSAALTRLTRQRRFEVVHGYEWGPAVDLAFGPHRLLGTPLVTTVMSMDVPDFLPTHTPLVVGTADLARAQQGVRTTHLMEPWIDTVKNAPEAVDASEARRRFGLPEQAFVVSVVGRLTDDLEKATGVLVAMDVVAEAHRAGTRPWRLLVVGDGPRFADVRRRAQQVNARLSEDVVMVVGALLDPRPAYACADVVVGMGSSALKGLAFAKPLVVQGSGGYWELFDEKTVSVFLARGFYGVGSNQAGLSGGPALLAALRDLSSPTTDPYRLGWSGRHLIEQRFSLSSAVEQQLRIYESALQHQADDRSRRRGLRRTALEVTKFKASRALHGRVHLPRRRTTPEGAL